MSRAQTSSVLSSRKTASNQDPGEDEIDESDMHLEIPTNINENKLVFNQSLINEEKYRQVEEYQTKLRQDLRTEEGLILHLNRIIAKRRQLRDYEKKLLFTLKHRPLANRWERQEFYRYLVDNELEWFDINRIPNDGCVLLVGHRGSGKTFMTQWLMFAKGKVFPFVYCLTQTKFNGAWVKHIADDWVLEGWNAGVVQQIKQRQANVIKTPEFGTDPRVAVILDDMAANPALRYDRDLLEFSFYGRHLITFIAVTSQWYKQLSPGFRDNSDVIFLFKLDNENEIEALWKEHGGGMPKEIFENLVRRYSSDTTALVIVKNGMSPFRRFFQYRAQKPPPHRLGCYKVWQEG